MTDDEMIERIEEQDRRITTLEDALRRVIHSLMDLAGTL